MAADDSGLTDFLQNVDEIESIVKGLVSKDNSLSKEAIAHADSFIEKYDLHKSVKPSTDNTGVNRTVINQKAFEDDSPAVGPPHTDNMDCDSFMSTMAADADERAKRRRAREKEATQLKLKGNEQFAAANYEQALEFYTQAIQLVRDMTALYTNRAQTFIKLGQHEKAIEDCDWALRVFENCVKAHVHKGKAYLGLKQYDNAIESYENAMKVDPGKEHLFKAYCSEVESARQIDDEERCARKAFDGGDQNALDIVALLEKVTKPDQSPLYYSGGLRIVADVLNNISNRTIFRTHKGLQLTQTHRLIKQCFSTCPRRLAEDHLDLCAATLMAFTAACTSCDENVRQLLAVADLPAQLLRFLQVALKSVRVVREETTRLLHQICESAVGRTAVVTHFDLQSLLASLFRLMKLKSNVAVTAVGILNNIALTPGFKNQLRDRFSETVLPAFEDLLAEGSTNLAVLPSCVSSMANLCTDKHIRHQLAAHDPTWESCRRLLVQFGGEGSASRGEAIVCAVLSLLCNVCHDVAPARAARYAPPLCAACLPLLAPGAARLRTTALLAKLLQHSSEATAQCCERGAVISFINVLQSEEEEDLELLKQTTRCLTACTQHSGDARTQLLHTTGGLSTLVRLLKAGDEVIVGNSALSLSHLCNDPAVCSRLADTDIVMTTLVTARDGRRHAAQNNCAVLIAKLARGDERHLERLRELHGLEILHDVLKHAP